MVKVLSKLLIGSGLSLVLMLAFSFVKAETVKACDTSGGVYGCFNIHVMDGYDGGPGLAGASVKVEIGPIKSGFYCLSPGRSNTTITTTTDSYGNATVDNICCTSVVEYVKVTITKLGYYDYGPYNWDISNGPETAINIYLAKIPEPPKPTTSPSNLSETDGCYGSATTPQVIFSFTPSSAGGDHDIFVNTSNNFTGPHLAKTANSGPFTWDADHQMTYAGYGAPNSAPQNSTTYYWAVYSYSARKYGYPSGSFTTYSAADCTNNPPTTQKGTLMVRVFGDENGNGLLDGESTLLETDAPGTIVRRGSETGTRLTRNSSTQLTYSNDLSEDSYRIYLLPDSNWEITKYSVRAYGDSGYSAHSYSAGSNGYSRTTSIYVTASETSHVRLGVKRRDQPNLTADTAQINNGVNTFVRTSSPVPVYGIVKNIGVAKDLPNIGVGFYVDKNITDSSSISSTSRAGQTTVSLTTSSMQSYASGEISVGSLSYGPHTFQVCADYPQAITESNEADNCSPSVTFTLAEAQDQWLQTQRGDVGTRGNIILGYHPAGGNNADYLVVAQTALVNNFTSVKNWLIKSYTPLNVYPTASASYTSLLALYSKSGISTLPGSSMNDVSNISTNVGQTTGNLTISWTGTYADNPKVIFVNGNLSIQSNLRIEKGTGLIFVVSGSITIASSVTQADGVFISYGTFNTTSYAGCSVPLTETHQQLVINGAIYAFGQACFTRNLGKVNNANPAELIIYEPKYLVLFREALGETVTSFKEVTP